MLEFDLVQIYTEIIFNGSSIMWGVIRLTKQFPVLKKLFKIQLFDQNIDKWFEYDVIKSLKLNEM